MSPYYVNAYFDTLQRIRGAYLGQVDYASRADAEAGSARLRKACVRTLYRIKVTMKVPA